MQKVILELEDSVFWRLLEQAAREHRKAHEYAEQLIEQALDSQPEPQAA